MAENNLQQPPMYRTTGTTMNNIQPEDDEENNVVSGDDLDNNNHQIPYDPHHHSHLLQNGGVVGGGGAISIYGPPPSNNEVPPPASGGSDQLTLSFQGEVYVFDAVPAEKVQAVLLLLGGYEVPTGIPTSGMAPQNHRGQFDLPGRLSQPERAASLNRFREKRKERCFDKKIRYNVRKEVALRMQRKKGQFTSSKAFSEDMGSYSSDWNGNSGHEEQETSCRHCGISSKSTPMMRRGPDGPRTLCNACGLKWASKGVLRDLPKVLTVGTHDPTMKVIEQSDGEANDSDAMTAANDVITSSNGDNSTLTAEQ